MNVGDVTRYDPMASEAGDALGDLGGAAHRLYDGARSR